MTWVARRPRWFRTLCGLAMLAAGAGMFLLGEAMVPRLAGRNVPVNAGATDKTNIAAHNSPTLVRNPTRPDHIVVVSRVDTPHFSCAVHFSSDAGATWKPGTLSTPDGRPCFTPDATFGPDGVLYASFVTLSGDNNAPDAVWVARSTDGGSTFSPAVRALGSNAVHVRLAADPVRPGALRLTWVQAAEIAPYGLSGAGSPVMFSSSEDGGATWRAPVAISSSSRPRVIGPTPALSTGAAAARDLVVAYIDLRDDELYYRGAHLNPGAPPFNGKWSLVMARSADGGATWQESVVDDEIAPTARLTTRFPRTPSMAVGPEPKRVYVSFADGRLGDQDVWLWASGDAGASFSSARRVNDTPERDGRTQALPAVAVASTGRVDVVYYDRRGDPRDIQTEVSLQSSFDSGQSFGSRVRISDHHFDSRVGFGSERGVPEVGSRLAIVSVPGRAMAVWADTRAGTTSTNKQDLAKAVVTIPRPSPLRQPFRYGGPAVAAGGLAVLVLSRPRREPRGLTARTPSRRRRKRRLRAGPSRSQASGADSRLVPDERYAAAVVGAGAVGDGARAHAEEVIAAFEGAVAALSASLTALQALKRPRLLGKVEQEQRRVDKASASLAEARRALEADQMAACGRAVLDADRSLSALGSELTPALTLELAEAKLSGLSRAGLQENVARRTEVHGDLADERQRQQQGETATRDMLLVAASAYQLDAEHLALAVDAFSGPSSHTPRRTR